jgi:hypothetical protein
MSIELDQTSLDNLTDEERSAIEDTSYSPEELAAMKAVAGADDEADESDDDDKETSAEKTADASVADESKPATTDLDATADVPEFKPQYKVDLPDDYEAKVTELKEEKRALAAKFKDGDIEFEDYTTQMEALDDRRDELNDLRVRASVAQDMNTQTAEQQWQHTVRQFTSAVARDEKIDYAKDAEKQADLDLFVKSLAANEKNADKSMEWFLSEAHKRVKALHGIGGKPDPTPSADPKPSAKPSRKPPVEHLPGTLAQVPGGDGPGDLAGEFADLDRLEGLEYEQAIARMTPVQRERFLQGK